MAAGRPRKPVHIKKAQGTLAKSREIDNPVTFEALNKIPDVPDLIPNEGKEYFTYCCELLFSIGMLSAAYIPDITRAAFYYAIFIRAGKIIRDSGYSQVASSGYTSITAHLTALTKAQKELKEFESKYGFNLVSSQKISMPKKKNKYLK